MQRWSIGIAATVWVPPLWPWGEEGKGGLVALHTGGLVLASLEESMVVLFWGGQSCFLVHPRASLPDMAIWNSTRLCLQPLPLFWMSKSRGGRKKERVLGSDKCFPFLSVSLLNGRIPKHLMTPEHKCFYYYCVWPQAILGEKFCSGRYPLKKQQQNVIKGPQIN